VRLRSIWPLSCTASGRQKCWAGRSARAGGQRRDVTRNAYARFRRALTTGNPRLALDAARELNHITLEDALGLCLLLRPDERRYQHAAARWLARYHADVEGVTLTDMREIADVLAAIPVHGKRLRTTWRLSSRHVDCTVARAACARLWVANRRAGDR
jgi:hypothetical protein